jgi:multidrug efflux pump subunit AcrA (membrane-fusion protein)
MKTDTRKIACRAPDVRLVGLDASIDLQRRGVAALPDRTQMQVEDNPVNLSPGMAVTVEIKTGSRTIISYLLSPLLRYRQESLRER